MRSSSLLTPGPYMLRVACRIAVMILLAPGTGTAQPPAQQPDTTTLQRILAAEDARGTGPDGLTPLLDARSSPDTLLRRLAVRGLGRMQRPELGRLLVPLLRDSIPAVRAETATAIAQSMRRVPRTDSVKAQSAAFSTREAARALTEALAAEAAPEVRDALAQSLGRLALPDSASAREAEGAIRATLERQQSAGVIHGLYTLARSRKATGNLDAGSVALLRHGALASPDTMVRRLALRTLAAAGGLDSATAVGAIHDRDDESRRMTLRGSGDLSPTLRAALVRTGFRDSSVIVRIEAVAAARLGDGPPDCRPIVEGTRDPVPAIALTAVDSLGSGCADSPGAVAVLRRLAAGPVRSGPADHRWQMPAHSLLALARLDPSAAAHLVPSAARSDRWETRV
ncbi:MAG: HEAT repeat domain-containing protein [Gemmatimonadales bacterium]